MFIDNQNSREKLMRRMQMYSFAVYDALLYLDAYPDSREALSYYNKYKKMAERAQAEYEQKYGPVTLPSEASSWEWSSGIWPWQMEGDK